MDIATLDQQHRALSQVAAELARQIASAEPRPVAAIRWRLARLLIAHLAIEDRWLYPLVLAGDAPASRIARTYQTEMGGLADAFSRYMAKWTDARVGEDWPGFRAETRPILEALAARIEREDRVLYPLARRLDRRSSPVVDG